MQALSTVNATADFKLLERTTSKNNIRHTQKLPHARSVDDSVQVPDAGLATEYWSCT